MATNGRSGRTTSQAESNNGASAPRPVRLIKKRKKRTLSLDAEIRAQAKTIYETGMAEAYKGAALAIVGRKLDEIRAILNAAGFQSVAGVPVYAAPSPQAVQRPAQPTGPTCVQCGQPAVRRARANKWNQGNPPWFCSVHQALAGKIEAEDAIDSALIGAQGPAMKPKPVVTITNAPAVMVKQAEVVEPEPVAAPVDGLSGAMAALGVADEA